MASFDFQQADLSLSYLLSFVKGSQIEYNTERIPENVKYSKVDPIKPITQQNASLYSVEFNIDLSTITATNVDMLYLIMQLPEQKVNPSAGEFFAYSDLPAIKMINRIDIMFNSYDNVIESLTPTVIYLRLLEKYASNGSIEKWNDTAAAFLGGQNNSVAYTDQEAQTVLLPIPCDLFPISINHIFKSDVDRMSPVHIYVRVYLNPVQAFSVRSPAYEPTNFLTTTSVSECALLLEQKWRVQEPLKLSAPSTLADYHVASKYSFTFSQQRSVSPKTDFVKLLDDAYINRLYLCMYNPFISTSGKAYSFYGNYCYNALENYVNSFIYPSLPVSNETVLNLRDGTLTNSSDVIVQLVNTNTYVVTHLQTSITVVCANLDWQNLPENIYFDIGSLLKSTTVPISPFIKSLFFYLKPSLYETTTPIPAITKGSHGAFLEGLYYSADGSWAIYGFANIELRDTLTSEDMFYLKFLISQPVALATPSVFAARKYCVWNDPVFLFADLDRSIKYGASDLDVISTNRKTFDTSTKRTDWVNVAVQDYTNRMQAETALQQYLPATYFSFGTAVDRLGYLDTVWTSYEINYAIQFNEAITNRRIVPSATRQKAINTYYGNIEVRVDYVYMLVRFLVYSTKQVYAYTTNKNIYQGIINDYYNGVMPRQIDGKMIIFNQQVAEKKRKRARFI